MSKAKDFLLLLGLSACAQAQVGPNPNWSYSVQNGQPTAAYQGNLFATGNVQAIGNVSVGSLATGTPLNVNASDLGSEMNLVALSGRNMAYYQSPNDSTAPWYVIRDGFTGTRGAGGPGDGNGPHFVLQSWSAASSAFVSSIDFNGGLIKASAPIASDLDVVGYRAGTNEVMLALDGLRPALIPGTDSNYALGDINTGANHSLQRWTYGYFVNGVCVGCTTSAPTDPFQATVSNNANTGVNLNSGTGTVHVSPSFASSAYSSTIVVAGDSGIVTSAPFVIAPASSSQGARWSATGALTQTGPLIIAGSGAYLQLPKSTVASLPSCASGNEGELAAVTDASSATFNAALAGSGANHVMAYCNGSGWTVH